LANHNQHNEELKSRVDGLPEKPGVYQFMDKQGDVIYIGKAKNLKKRVLSYFSKSLVGKTAIMMRHVREIAHVIVDSESDALLLENNLIKKHQPRYNILLKDDKSFPWICIKKEHFPRVFHTRKKVNDGSKYFGPYTSMVVVRTLLDMIKQLYPLRNCNYRLDPESIRKNKFKVCLEYHMGNCLGPCVGLQESSDYDDRVQQIESILKGNINSVFSHLTRLMNRYASDYQYEKANKIKEKIKILERFQSKSTIVNPSLHNLDVFSYTEDEEQAYVNYLKISHGAVIQAHTAEMKRKLEETKEDLLLFAITEMRQRMFSSAKQIIVPFKLPFELEGCRLTVPRKGEKQKLLRLSERNVTHYRLQKSRKKMEQTVPSSRVSLLHNMAQDLRLKKLPVRIECFDVSNIQGRSAVASCVVFNNARPSKKEYRHYHIKTVAGANDYASISEVVLRRYRRLLDERQELPQLIVIDGGKGQLHAALKSLAILGLKGTIPIIGIAKRLEEIYFPGDPVPLYLKKSSESLKLLQYVRNEAHRFGISFHRNKRSREQVKSIMDDIKGIGPQTVQKLMLEFKSIEGIRKAERAQLEESIGVSRARMLYDFFHGSTREE